MCTHDRTYPVSCPALPVIRAIPACTGNLLARGATTGTRKAGNHLPAPHAPGRAGFGDTDPETPGRESTRPGTQPRSGPMTNTPTSTSTPRREDCGQRTGFEAVRSELRAHDARVRARRWLAQASLLDDVKTVVVHVNNAGPTDQIRLTAYDADGRFTGGHTVHGDHGEGFDPIDEFRLQAPASFPPGCDFDKASPDGWMVDLALIRAYDEAADRQATERRILLALLGGLVAAGQLRHVLFDDDHLLGN